MSENTDDQAAVNDTKGMSEAEIEAYMQAIEDDIKAENEVWRRALILEIMSRRFGGESGD